jgi:hypothetical protein
LGTKAQSARRVHPFSNFDLFSKYLKFSHPTEV